MKTNMNEYYQKWWESPEDIRNIVFEKLNKYVQKRIPEGEGKKALDIGSGKGRIISYLLEKGYDVTAVEINEEFCYELKEKYPQIKIVEGDILKQNITEKYDIVTCIELPFFNETNMLDLLNKLSGITKLLLINISNRNSFHNRWVNLRGWKNSFVVDHTPYKFETMLKEANFKVLHRRGIGLITPISLLPNFKYKLVHPIFANLINSFDKYFNEYCHLYYIEARSEKI